MFYFFLFSGIAFAVLSWLKPKWALTAIFLLLPTYQLRYLFFSIPITWLETMIILLGLNYLVRLLIQKTIKKEIVYLFNHYLVWIIFVVLWLLSASLALWITPELRPAAGIWKAYFIEPIILFLIILSLIKKKNNNQKELNFIIQPLLFSALIVAFWGILQKYWGGGVLSTETWGAPQVWRATGPFVQPNFLGLFLAPLIVLAITKLLMVICQKNYSIRNIKKINFYQLLLFLYYFLIFSSGVLALILARSEGALLAVLTACLFLGILFRPTRRIVLIILLVLLMILIAHSGLRGYVLEKALLQDLSGRLRINIWKGALNLLQDRPILGAGLKGYQYLIPNFQARYYNQISGELVSVETHPYPHNLGLALWSELGLFGLIVFISLIARFFWQGFKRLRGKLSAKPLTKQNQLLILGVLAGLVVVLIHGLVDTPYFKNDLSVLFWGLIGIGVILYKNDK